MKKLLNTLVLILILIMPLSALSVLADSEGILKNKVLYSWDFSSEEQTTSDSSLTDIPILNGSAEYSADNQNIKLNATSGAGMTVNLSTPVSYETSENVINVEFDANLGSIDKQYFTYEIKSGESNLIECSFMPYNKAGATGYLKVGGVDIIEDTDDANVNKQLINCISSAKADGMTAAVTHFRNEINLADGSVTVYITSGSKSGTFTGSFDTSEYNNITGLNFDITKNSTSRYTYIDNIKISQYQRIAAPDPSELVYDIVTKSDGDITTVDTSKMVYGDTIKTFLVTTAKDGKVVKQYTTAVDDSVNVDSKGAEDIEILPIYTYENLDESAFNTENGVTLDGTFEDGRYNFSFQKSNGTLTDIYVNGYMVGNNIEQTGKGRGTPKGSLYSVNDIKIEGGSINISTRRDEYNGRTYPNAPISTITINKVPQILNRKTKITLMGDSLVCEYYGGRRESDLGSNQTGWGQQLGNFIDKDKYEILNLANSGHYAKILYETATGGAIYNSQAGDIVIYQCGYNDYKRSSKEEMVEYMTKMVQDAKNAGVRMIFVTPPATCDPEDWLDHTAADYKNTSYSYPVRLGETVIETAKNLDVEYIDLSKYSYDYLTLLYGSDITEAGELYIQNLGVKDYIHLSYAGAMKWASYIAQTLFDRNYIDSINTDFSYKVTDTQNNEIECKVTENKDDSFDRYLISADDENINVRIMAHTEGNVYVCLYSENGKLQNIQSVMGNENVQTVTLPISHESGAYIKMFDWTENMKPVCQPSKNIYLEDINMDYSYEALEGKTVYAFGDSIVYGHKTPSQSFMRLMADDYNMNLGMYAVNGATVVSEDSSEKEDSSEETKGNYIIKQVKNAPDEKPDVIVFDGYTNDAYGDPKTDSFNSSGGHINILENLGEIQGNTATKFNGSTFCGGFEEIIYTMKQKWPDTPIVFVTIHKSGGRDWDVQCKLRDLSLEMCDKWGVEVVDIFKDTNLDTRDEGVMEKYIIGGAGSHPNVSACREFYIPLVSKKLNDILSREKYTLPENINDTVDVAVFAGQSNMSGRGTAADATVCDVNAGFEYKSVSNPTTLVPIQEPFGLNEDRENGIYDYNSDGTTKRTGSMVSSVVDAYYKNTGRQLVAVSASIGGTNTTQWKNTYISDAVKRLDDTKKFLEVNGIKVGRTFVVWCQGESDGDAKTTAENYKSNTKDIFNTFKEHGAENCFMVQIGHYNYVKYSGNKDGLTGAEWDEKYGIIRMAQAELCESDNDFTLVGSFEPYITDMKDRYHYNQATYNAVGKTVGENIAKYYN